MALRRWWAAPQHIAARLAPPPPVEQRWRRASSQARLPVGSLTPRAAFRLLKFHPQAGEAKEAVTKRLKRCYIDGTLKCHPDLFPHDAKATEAFQQLSEALRVALAYHALVFGRGGAGTMDTVGDGVDDGDDRFGTATAVSSAANVLVALQRAIDDVNQPNAAATAHESHASPRSAATLESVADVCLVQTQSSAKLRTFCHELPTTLCGRKCPLFEVFCFHAVRRSSELEPFVLQFSKDLPLIVRRVVKRRSLVIKPAQLHTVGGGAAFGVASGDSARTKKIEDMLMKPLVLVGALVIALDKATADASQLAGVSQPAAGGDTTTSPQPPHAVRRLIAAGRPDVAVGADIKCHRELRCVVLATDTIDEVVAKLSDWEAASYQRLLLELTTGNVLSLLSAQLCLVPTRSHLVMLHDLEISSHKAQRVGFTVQHLLTMACLYGSGMDVAVEGVQGASDNDAIRGTLISERISEIRALCEAIDADAIKGGIHLQLDSSSGRNQDTTGGADATGADADVYDDFLVQSREDILKASADVPDTDGSESDDASKMKTATTAGRLTKAPFRVSRHPSSCEATDLVFAVTVTLQRDALAFFTAIRDALLDVDRRYNAALDVLPALVDLRDQVYAAEWIPLTAEGDTADDASSTPNCSGGGLETESCKAHVDATTARADHRIATMGTVAATIAEEHDDYATVVSPAGLDTADARPALWETSLPSDVFGSSDATSVTVESGCPSFDGSGASSSRVLDAPVQPSPQHRFRRSISCVARVYNMHADQERLLWQRIYDHREYLAAHQAMLGSWNVFFEVSPYEAGDGAAAGGASGGAAAPHVNASASPDAGGGGGWCGCTSDGVEMLLLTKADLDTSQSFLTWLEDAVEQTSLSRECHRLLGHHRIGYMHRHPSLPLSHFLSFLTLFTSPAGNAARGLLEHRRRRPASAADLPLNQQTASSAQPAGIVGRGEVSAQDIGFSMVITTGMCDIRDGGRLHVPWNVDPSHLVAALEGGAFTAADLIGA